MRPRLGGGAAGDRVEGGDVVVVAAIRDGFSKVVEVEAVEGGLLVRLGKAVAFLRAVSQEESLEVRRWGLVSIVPGGTVDAGGRVEAISGLEAVDLARRYLPSGPG